MQKHPLVSVMLPAYNAEKWLEESIESLVNQTYKNIEILIIDDNSHDRTFEIIKHFSLLDSRIKTYKNKYNEGIVGCLNFLIKEASGKYIARMDADDIAHPKRLEKQIKAILENNIDLCGTWFKEFGQGLPRVTRWPTTHESLEASLIFQNTICHPTIVAKREVFETFPYREEFKLAEDYDFFTRAIKVYKLHNLPEPLLNYRRHANQATQAKRNKMEEISKKIRLAALNNIGIYPSHQQFSTHNKIRAPKSIHTLKDLDLIEEWLITLIDSKNSLEFKNIVATQWLRACIRSAPLGASMRRKYFSSPLVELIKPSLLSNIDIFILSIMKLDYSSDAFKLLRRIGLSV